MTKSCPKCQEYWGGESNRPVNSGDTVYLKAHTGKHIDVQGTAVKARWNGQGGWQALTMEKAGGGAVYDGDIIQLYSANCSAYTVQ